MKLLMITGDYPPIHSGEANHAFFLAKNLAEHGVDVHVITSSHAVDSPDDFATVHAIMPNWTWRYTPRLLRFIRKCNPDAILLIFLGAMYHRHPMTTVLPSLAKSVLPHVRFVTQFEATGSGASRANWLSRIVRKAVMFWIGNSGSCHPYGTLLRDSDSTIVLCERHRDVLERKCNGVEKRMHLIPPPALIQMADNSTESRRNERRSLGIDDSTFLLAFYGFVHHAKGFEYLLHALSEVCEVESDVRLLVIGGEMRHKHSRDRVAASERYVANMKQLARQLQLEDRIIWRGGADAESDRPSRLLYSSDACVFPFVKGVHLNNSSFAAAIRHGLPVITTATETTESAFRNDENVILCPPEDPNALGLAIRRLISSQTLRDALSSGARDMADQWFDWDETVNRTLQLLRLPEVSPMPTHSAT